MTSSSIPDPRTVLPDDLLAAARANVERAAPLTARQLAVVSSAFRGHVRKGLDRHNAA